MAAGLVDATAAEADEIITAATDWLHPIVGKNRDVLRAIKSTMFGAVTDALRQGRAQ